VRLGWGSDASQKSPISILVAGDDGAAAIDLMDARVAWNLPLNRIRHTLPRASPVLGLTFEGAEALRIEWLPSCRSEIDPNRHHVRPTCDDLFSGGICLTPLANRSSTIWSHAHSHRHTGDNVAHQHHPAHHLAMSPGLGHRYVCRRPFDALDRVGVESIPHHNTTQQHTGLLLLSMSNRYTHLTNKFRSVKTLEEKQVLYRRVRTIKWAILLALLSVLLLIILMLVFLWQLLSNKESQIEVVSIFTTALISLIISLGLFWGDMKHSLYLIHQDLIHQEEQAAEASAV
jgi:hypothetical protein